MLCCVDVSDVADVSEEVHSASIFRVEVCRLTDAVYTQTHQPTHCDHEDVGNKQHPHYVIT
jgi:hypothetical protein